MGFYCGVDIASKSSRFCALDNRRQMIKQGDFDMTPEGIEAVFNGHKNMTILMEACPQAEWLSGQILSLGKGHVVHIVCARKAQAAIGAQGKKTDTRDARGLAELCKSGWYEEVHRKSNEARALRSYLTARKQLVKSATGIACSIKGLFNSFGMKISLQAGGDSFIEHVKMEAEKLPLLAREGIAGLLEAYKVTQRTQKEMYKQLGKIRLENKVVSLLQTVPGVGPATASAFFATIDDPQRFKSGAELASYLGLVPRVYQSGNTNYRGRITKCGDTLLRWLLVESASALLTRSNAVCDLKAWGQRLADKKGNGKAKVAVARKLCGILLAMWKQMKPFHPEPIVAQI